MTAATTGTGDGVVPDDGETYPGEWVRKHNCRQADQPASQSADTTSAPVTCTDDNGVDTGLRHRHRVTAARRTRPVRLTPVRMGVTSIP